MTTKPVQTILAILCGAMAGIIVADFTGSLLWAFVAGGIAGMLVRQAVPVEKERAKKK